MITRATTVRRSTSSIETDVLQRAEHLGEHDGTEQDHRGVGDEKRSARRMPSSATNTVADTARTISPKSEISVKG